jgi:hypothetical protein
MTHTQKPWEFEQYINNMERWYEVFEIKENETESVYSTYDYEDAYRQKMTFQIDCPDSKFSIDKWGCEKNGTPFIIEGE